MVLFQVRFLNWYHFVCFFFLTCKQNPFIPCRADDVKLCCQGSRALGKLGWDFTWPEQRAWAGFLTCQGAAPSLGLRVKDKGGAAP